MKPITRREFATIAASATLVACGGGSDPQPSPDPAPQPVPPPAPVPAPELPKYTTLFEKQGFTVPGFSLRTPQMLTESLQDAIATGANAVIVDYHLTSPDGITGSTLQHELPPATLLQAVGVAKSLGLEVWIKPIVLAPPNNNWQNLAPTNPTAWFADYTALLLDIVQAQGGDKIDAVLLGNELYSMSNGVQYKSGWLALIAQLRAGFAGKLGYNAGGLLGPWDSSQEYLHVTFLDAIDFLGISAYPRLSVKPDATVADFVAGWTNNAFGENLLQMLNHAIASLGKDIYLTELGSPALHGGNMLFQPYAVPPQYDLQQQADFFTASLPLLADKTNGKLHGVFGYNWHANAGDTWGFEPDKNPTADYPGPYIWNLYGKPAQEAIRNAWLK